jgi:hypothetical protein
MNDRLRTFWTKNRYIHKIQKGALNDVAGCLEHTFSMFEALKDAKLHKRQIVVTWLDLKNAYGSVRHNLIQFALEWYHVPEWFAEIVFQYYDSLSAFIFTDDWQSDLFAFQTGVFQGCVISPTLFIGVFQIILDFIDQFGAQPYVFHDNKVSERLTLAQQAYVDDHTLINASPVGAQHNLDQLDIILEWTHCLIIKVPKCRCLALGDKRFKQGDNKGLSYGPFDPKLLYNSDSIIFLANGSEEKDSFKFLGRKTWSSINSPNALRLSLAEFESDLSLVDNSLVSGASKVWIYQFMVVARLIWPFLINDFSIHGVAPFETLATKHIKSWYGFNKPGNPSLLYLPSSSGVCGWNLTSPVQLLKSMQIVGQHIIKYSKDSLTRNLASLSRSKAIESKSKKWKPGKELEKFEEILSFNINFGGQSGRQGLGHGRKKNLRRASLKERRKAITELCKREEADSRLVRLQDLAISGDFLKWDHLMDNQLDWNSQVLDMSPEELSFLINAQGSVLPSPANVRRWGFNSAGKCLICGKPNATTAHILNGCPKSLFQDRYTWRHDNVLTAIQSDLVGLVARANRKVPQKHSVCPISQSFVKSGSRPFKTQTVARSSLLDLANDWELLIDYGGSLVFPPVTGIITTQRPDVIIFSASKKIIIWAELTVPQERRTAISAVIKKKRYRDLEVQLLLRKWTPYAHTIEVGSIGFLAHSFRSFFLRIGTRNPQLNSVLHRAAKAARRSSFYVWNARHSENWIPPTLYARREIKSPAPQVSPPPSRAPSNVTSTIIAPAQLSRLEDLDFDLDLEAEREIEYEKLSHLP